jgi:hypothetical protein
MKKYILLMFLSILTIAFQDSCSVKAMDIINREAKNSLILDKNACLGSSVDYDIPELGPHRVEFRQDSDNDMANAGTVGSMGNGLIVNCDDMANAGTVGSMDNGLILNCTDNLDTEEDSLDQYNDDMLISQKELDDVANDNDTKKRLQELLADERFLRSKREAQEQPLYEEQLAREKHLQESFKNKIDNYKTLFEIGSNEVISLHDLYQLYETKFKELNDMSIEELIDMRIDELKAKLNSILCDQQGDLKKKLEEYQSGDDFLREDYSMNAEFHSSSFKKTRDCVIKSFDTEKLYYKTQLRKLENYKRMINIVKIKIALVKQQYKENYSLPLQNFKQLTSFDVNMRKEYPQQSEEILSYTDNYRNLLLNQLTNAYNVLSGVIQ